MPVTRLRGRSSVAYKATGVGPGKDKGGGTLGLSQVDEPFYLFVKYYGVRGSAKKRKLRQLTISDKLLARHLRGTTPA